MQHVMAKLNCELACYFQLRGVVGWGGDGLFNSYTSRDSLYDISAPQAIFLSVLHVFAAGNVISRGFEA